MLSIGNVTSKSVGTVVAELLSRTADSYSRKYFLVVRQSIFISVEVAINQFIILPHQPFVGRRDCLEILGFNGEALPPDPTFMKFLSHIINAQLSDLSDGLVKLQGVPF